MSYRDENECYLEVRMYFWPIISIISKDIINLARGWLHVPPVLHHHQIYPGHHPGHLLPHNSFIHDLHRSQIQVLWRHLLRLAFSRLVWNFILLVGDYLLRDFWDMSLVKTLARKYDYMEDHLFASLALNKHDFFGKQVNIIH